MDGRQAQVQRGHIALWSDQYGAHAQSARAFDVGVGVVADHDRLIGRNPQHFARAVKQQGLRLADDFRLGVGKA